MSEEAGEVDRLSNLPQSLLFEVLLNLPTKDVVKTSVLSSNWRNLWKFVPGLNLTYQRDFTDYNTFVSFVDAFLGLDSVSCIKKFNLHFEYVYGTLEAVHLTRWINKVIERKVQHLYVYDKTWARDEVGLPTTVYTCKSLVSLKLYDVILPNPEFVSLPCLKVLVLHTVGIPNNFAFEMLISGCPVLESLALTRFVWRSNLLKVLRVCSHSLLSFTYCSRVCDEDLVVAIYAPRLEYLKLDDYETPSFIIESSGSLVKMDIDIAFSLSPEEEFNQNDLPKKSMIGNFLMGISSVKTLKISPLTLEVLSNYSRCEPLPSFYNLSFLRVDFDNYSWEMLPGFLESCPNIKSLSLVFSIRERVERFGIVPEPRQLLTSLEYVKIVKPMLENTAHMNLVSYFLENSPILKKFTLFLAGYIKNEESVFLKKLLAVPRLSGSCEFLFEHTNTP